MTGRRACHLPRMLRCLRLAARAKAKGDPAMQDDLFQHAWLYLRVRMKGAHTFSFILWKANNVMRDLLRYEAVRLRHENVDHLDVGSDGQVRNRQP